jgi:hypothetical protein
LHRPIACKENDPFNENGNVPLSAIRNAAGAVSCAERQAAGRRSRGRPRYWRFAIDLVDSHAPRRRIARFVVPLKLDKWKYFVIASSYAKS